MNTVLLVTGWASPKEIWSPVCSLLSDEYLLQVITAQEILKTGPEIWKQFAGTRPICVGWSMGGMLLVEAISDQLLDAQGLILVSSCAKMGSSNGLVERNLKSMRRQLDTDPSKVVRDFWEIVRPGETRFSSLVESDDSLTDGLSYLAQRDLHTELQLVDTPTTIIHGILDPIIPLELGSQLAEGISNSKFVEIDGGHDLPLSNPELIAQEIRVISNFKNTLEFSNSATTYDRWAEPQRVIGENLLAASKKWLVDEAEVLDVGCGTGFMIATIKKHFPKTKFTGLDSAQGMIDFCNKRFKDCADVNFAVGDAQSALPNGPWDFITSNSMLQWMEDLPKGFSEWKNELAADGKIIFSTLVSGSFTEFEESYLKAVGRRSSSLSWKESEFYLETLEKLSFKTYLHEERTFKFSYKNALEALLVFKRIGAINKKERPLSVSQTRELIRYYESNFPAELGGVQVSYKALFVVAGADNLKA
jgi:malonyl-ACP O-methyltransferase BioC